MPKNWENLFSHFEGDQPQTKKNHKANFLIWRKTQKLTLRNRITVIYSAIEQFLSLKIR